MFTKEIGPTLGLFLILFSSCLTLNITNNKKIKEYYIYEYLVDEVHVVNSNSNNPLVSELLFLDSVLLELDYGDTLTTILNGRTCEVFFSNKMEIRIGKNTTEIYEFYIDLGPSGSELGYIGFYSNLIGTIHLRLTEGKREISLKRTDRYYNQDELSDIRKQLDLIY